jgi:hypothetical protein
MIDGLEEPMHQAARLQFERLVGEYVRWRAVPEDRRSPAPAWWWGPAFEMRGMQRPMPPEWCSNLDLPNGSSFSDGAGIFLKSLAGQTLLPWPGGFPGRAGESEPA